LRISMYRRLRGEKLQQGLGNGLRTSRKEKKRRGVHLGLTFVSELMIVGSAFKEFH